MFETTLLSESAGAAAAAQQAHLFFAHLAHTLITPTCTAQAGATGTWAEPRGDHGAGFQGAARLRRRYLPPFPGRRADAQLAPRQRCPAR